MTSIDNSTDLARRLPWLLVFRAAVASTLLVLTVAADTLEWPLGRISLLLYGVIVGTYLVVVVIGLLIRSGVSLPVLSGVHLATTVMATVMIEMGTGGVRSFLTFLYLLAILDGAIIGGRRVAMGVASACTLLHGAVLTAQLYDVLFLGTIPATSRFTTSALIHGLGFYLVAWLGGYLADLVETAQGRAKAAKFDLLSARHLHRTILDSLPVGVITMDVDTNVVAANASAARMFGISGDGLIGAQPPYVVASFLGEARMSRELDVCIGGEARTWYVVQAPVGGRVDAPALTTLVIDDRTELRDLEANFRTQEQMASIGALAASIAHEIRNPLASLSGAIELIFQGRESASSQERLRKIVTREIGRLDALIKDFLQYAKPAPPRRVMTDLTNLASEVMAMLEHSGAWSKHTHEVDAPADMRVWVDPGQMRQVLWNLLKNALEAQPGQGDVGIRLRTESATLEIDVWDRGPGFSPAMRTEAFEPFRTSKEHGTGLGLAIVKRVVEGHGGTISVRPDEGGGARVSIRIPEVKPPDSGS